jgi:hypothetical protein
MIASAAPSARVVVLNACWSDTVAAALHHAVECVISMNGAVGDDAACSFAESFYRARQWPLGRQRGRAGGRDARGQATSRRAPTGLLSRAGVDAHRLVLAREWR